MIIPLSLIKELLRLAKDKMWCPHHHKQNPNEKAWKDCCKQDELGLHYICCRCRKEKWMI